MAKRGEPRTYDVAIVGLGAMGSAAAYHLAKRGARAIGFDRFAPPHTLGSSHGESRIIREAYWEDPLYVPLVRRAYELWAELERESGKWLFDETGALFMGVLDGVLVPGCRRTAREHAIPHRNYTAKSAHAKYPQFRPSAKMAAFWERRGGTLFPERCVEAHLSLARRHGATLRYHEPVTRWKATPAGVMITTSRGAYSAKRLILSVGAWAPELFGAPTLPLTVERQVLYWFKPKSGAERWAPAVCPIFAFEPEKEKLFYGFPDYGNGVKIALHHQGETTTAETIRREVGADEVAGMRRLIRRYIPSLDGEVVKTATCLYTNTPDTHYLIDFHPKHRNVLLASPCSGHGFKYSSVVGEVLADLAMTGKSRFDLAPFKVGRLLKAKATPRKIIRRRAA